MGSVGALVWTTLFFSCLRDGRLISGMVNTGQCGPRIGRVSFCRETPTDLGGGSASRIACWSLSRQSYTPLSRNQVAEQPELVGRARRGPPHLARRPMAQEDAVIKEIRLASERGFVPSPTEVHEVRRDMGRMRPEEQ